jgi:exonuclease III
MVTPQSLPKRKKTIRFGTYNIQSGRNGRLEQALRAMGQMGMDWGLFTEAKVTNGTHTRFSSEYHVIATEAASSSQGGLALFYRDSDTFQVESVRKHGPNVISFEMVVAGVRRPVIGAYIPPSDTELRSLEYILRALDTVEVGLDPILLGDLNSDLASPRTQWADDIATELLSRGLVDTLPLFKRRRRDATWTWRQPRGPDDSEIRSRCDYILSTERNLFTKVAVRDPRHFVSDHFMVMAEMPTAPMSRCTAYLRGRRRTPLQLPKRGPLTRADIKFEAVLDMVEGGVAKRRPRTPWISPATWTLVDRRTAMRRAPRYDQLLYRCLSRQIKKSIHTDRQNRTTEAGSTIEALLKSNELKEAWGVLQAWYNHAGDRPQKPSRQDLVTMTAEREELYRKRDPPGEPIPILLDRPYEIEDGTPTEWEIEEAVNRMPRGKSPGPSKMRAEHLKTWRAEAFPREGEGNRQHWDPFVDLVQHVYSTGEIPEAMAYAVCVLLPKADGGVRGLGLLEVIWKVLASILCERMNATIEWHDCIHGFRAERGCGTAIVEVKLFQQLAALAQIPVFAIFLDLRKAYDSVDRERTLELLDGYGVGPNMIRLLRAYWEQQLLAARQADYYGEPFKATRGLTQGDPLSPTIFNVVVDAIIRAWLSSMDDGAETTEGFGFNVFEKIACFYADDGMIGARDNEWLQVAISRLADLFDRIGLQTNTSKTEAMTCHPGSIRNRMSTEAYKRNRGVDGHNDTFRQRQRRRVECSECGANLACGSLRQHLRVRHGRIPAVVQDEAMEPARADYRVSFPKSQRRRNCPVPGCSGSAKTWDCLRRHFCHRHPADTICITEEGLDPLSQCERCGMHITPNAIRNGHWASLLCKRGSDRQRQRQAAEATRRASEIVFTIYGTPLPSVNTFKYLGRPIASNDDDWPALYRNITRARRKWGMIRRVLTREGASPMISGMFYKAIVQSVLLYGCETWTITPAMLKTLRGFHHRVARRLACRLPKLRQDGSWTYPRIEDARRIAGLFTIEHYVAVRQRSFIEKVALRPIRQLCEGAVRRTGGPPSRLYWWTQPTLEQEEAAHEVEGGDPEPALEQQ